jgi:predicted RNA-binding Zn-ribbon protein involved in translation (DUF1610 family)
MPANAKPQLNDDSGDVTSEESVSPFDCPHCGARYKLVRVELEPVEAGGHIACRSCGGPLKSHDGGHILKYFMVDRPRHAGRPRLVDQPSAGRDSVERSSASLETQPQRVV